MKDDINAIAARQARMLFGPQLPPDRLDLDELIDNPPSLGIALLIPLAHLAARLQRRSDALAERSVLEHPGPNFGPLSREEKALHGVQYRLHRLMQRIKGHAA